jgi:FixJ family two-component response regulator
MNPAPPIRVLIADDEEEILELLGEYLRARGFQVWTAGDGQDAIDLLRSVPLDLVLTDNRMPAIGGVELLSELQRLPQPVGCVVMTGFGTVEAAIRALKDGASDFILKPFKLREVHTALMRSYERLRDQREAVRNRELLAYYELAHSMSAPDAYSRLFGLFSGVSLRDLRATEVVVWLQAESGLQAVARAGTSGALARLTPELIRDLLNDGDGIVAAPLRTNGTRVGAVALGGVEMPAEEAGPRLQVLAMVLAEALTRVPWRPPAP